MGTENSGSEGGAPDSSGTATTVRQAMYWEASAINRLIHDSMRTYSSLAGIREDHLESLHDGIPEIIAAMRNSIVLVALDESSTVVGTVRLCSRKVDQYPEASVFKDQEYPDDATVLYLTRFAVLQSNRGSGIGSLLISAAEHIARSEGVPYLLLHTALSNEAVAGFYLRRGFAIDSVDLSRDYPRALFYKKLF